MEKSLVYHNQRNLIGWEVEINLETGDQQFKFDSVPIIKLLFCVLIGQKEIIKKLNLFIVTQGQHYIEMIQLKDTTIMSTYTKIS